jgi:hypothetical protein
MRVLTISEADLDSGEPGDPLVVAQADAPLVRAVMRLISESLAPTPPTPRPLRPLPSRGAGDETESDR